METIKTLEILFTEFGAKEYYGEEITQLEHATQAFELAREAGADQELCIAAFLHDIGHLLDDETDALGSVDHESLGGKWLRKKDFGERVALAAELHVLAKRYLCSTDATYQSKLSEASVLTLAMQGGLLSNEEIAAFEENEYFQDLIWIRRWDDEAKVKDKISLPLNYILDEIKDYLQKQEMSNPKHL